MAPSTLVPLLSTHALSAQHFELWSKIPTAAPKLPSPLPPDQLPLAGAWLLETGDLQGLPLSKKHSRLLYTSDGHMAASLRLPVQLPYIGFRMDYSGRWYSLVSSRRTRYVAEAPHGSHSRTKPPPPSAQGGVVNHLCRYNSPVGGLEHVPPPPPTVDTQALGNYGANRMRNASVDRSRGVLTLTPPTFGGRPLIWRRVVDFPTTY